MLRRFAARNDRRDFSFFLKPFPARNALHAQRHKHLLQLRVVNLLARVRKTNQANLFPFANGVREILLAQFFHADLFLIAFPVANRGDNFRRQILRRFEFRAQHAIDARAELALAFAFRRVLDKVGRNWKIIRRDEHQARLVRLNRRVVFLLRVRFVRTFGAASKIMPDDSDKHIALGNLRAAKLVRHFRARAKILHADTMQIVARLNRREHRVAILLQISGGGTEKDSFHLTRNVIASDLREAISNSRVGDCFASSDYAAQTAAPLRMLAMTDTSFVYSFDIR